MAETLQKNRIAAWDRELPTAIGGDYLTEDQAAALRSFLERLASTPRKADRSRRAGSSAAKAIDEISATIRVGVPCAGLRWVALIGARLRR